MSLFTQIPYDAGEILCVCVCTEWKQDWNSLYVWICTKKRASIRMHVCLRACASSASYVSMSHDRRVLLMLTKIRLLVIGSVNCSALLNYSRPGKGWGLPFSLSLSLPPSCSPCLVSGTWSGRRMRAPASPPSACHCVGHRATGWFSYLLGFSWARVRASTFALFITSDVIGVGGVQSHARSQEHSHSYSLIFLTDA